MRPPQPAILPFCISCAVKREKFEIGVVSVEKEMQPTPVFLPGALHRQRNLAGYSPWDLKKSDMAEWLTHTQTYTYVSKPSGYRQLSPVALKSPLQAWAMAAMLKLQPSLCCETISYIPADMRHLWSSNHLCLPASFPGFEPLTSTLWVSQIIVKYSYSHPQTVCV